MTWPQGSVPFAVEDLIQAGRMLDAAGRVGDAVALADAQATVTSLAAYVASLSPGMQAAVARRIVAALAKPKRFTPSVVPKRPAKLAEPGG